jgi:predicted RNase H-like HicB family nuclease
MKKSLQVCHRATANIKGVLMVNEVKLTAIYEEAEEGGYIGYIAELPGANTQGETLDEVRENLLEAMQMILEANREEAETRLSGKPGVTREQLTLRAA